MTERDLMAENYLITDYMHAERRYYGLSKTAIPVIAMQIVNTLPERARNCLKRHGIHSDYVLTKMSPSDLLAMTNFGEKSLEQVKNALAAQGLSLRKDND